MGGGGGEFPLHSSRGGGGYCELQICYIFLSIRSIDSNKNVENVLTTVTLFYGKFSMWIFRAFVKIRLHILRQPKYYNIQWRSSGTKRGGAQIFTQK